LRLPLGDDGVGAVLGHLDQVREEVLGHLDQVREDVLAWEKRTRATAVDD
jgi:hypothetical protein